MKEIEPNYLVEQTNNPIEDYKKACNLYFDNGKKIECSIMLKSSFEEFINNKSVQETFNGKPTLTQVNDYFRTIGMPPIEL